VSTLNDTLITYDNHKDFTQNISVEFTKGGGGARAPAPQPAAAYGGYPPAYGGWPPQQQQPYGGYTQPYQQQAPQQREEPPASKLFVGSLPMGITTEEIKGLFMEHGTVEDVFILPPRGDRGQGCAFVTFATPDEAAAAIAAKHDQLVNYPSFPEYKTPLLVKQSHGGVKRQRTW
jgi:hypothetical protein